MSNISTERKAAFYFGSGLVVVGMLMFLSFFLTVARGFGGVQPGPSAMLAPIIGMAIMLAGRAIRSVGARGFAGSGVMLDPTQAREDLRPYSKMAGGMIGDVLEHADVSRHAKAAAPERIIMVRCRACEFLNEENSKFCQECGTKL